MKFSTVELRIEGTRKTGRALRFENRKVTAIIYPTMKQRKLDGEKAFTYRIIDKRTRKEKRGTRLTEAAAKLAVAKRVEAVT